MFYNVICFSEVYDLFPDSGAFVFYPSQKDQDVLVVGRQLLFLYVMERKVWLIDLVFYGYHLSVRAGY